MFIFFVPKRGAELFLNTKFYKKDIFTFSLTNLVRLKQVCSIFREVHMSNTSYPLQVVFYCAMLRWFHFQ